jgi:two-component system response regulator HydG
MRLEREQDMGKVLIVDDEPSMRRILKANLRQDSHVSIEAASPPEAVALLLRETFDVVLTDQKMAGGSGLDVLLAVQESDPTTSVIFLTAVGTVELAVESMRQGAFDFLTKPYALDVMLATIRRACERTALLRENAVLRTTVRKLEGADEIIGKSKEIRVVREMISRVAQANSTVLITGETGTGKELVARAIHRNSSRANRSFIAINCAAVTETLLESELFGHERGAFTGADKARGGLFESAHEGTLFLDEVAEMSPAAQAKLLRVLANGEIQRVGSTTPRKVDVRVLAATHRDLQARVHSGQFREDLFYRLAVVPIQLPPLRERSEDIEELCHMLCARIAREMKVASKPLSQEAVAKLRKYAFPGNIRELANLLERALILGQDADLGPDDFPLQPGAAPSGKLDAEFTIEQVVAHFPQQVDLREVLAKLERNLIERAVKSSNGVQAEAARRLGLSRSDLGYKVGKYSE